MILKFNQHYNLTKYFNLIYNKNFYYIEDKLGGIIYIFDDYKTANIKYLDLI